VGAQERDTQSDPGGFEHEQTKVVNAVRHREGDDQADHRHKRQDPGAPDHRLQVAREEELADGDEQEAEGKQNEVVGNVAGSDLLDDELDREEGEQGEAGEREPNADAPAPRPRDDRPQAPEGEAERDDPGDSERDEHRLAPERPVEGELSALASEVEDAGEDRGQACAELVHLLLLSFAPGLHQPGLVGQHDGLDAVAQAELGEHVRDVGLLERREPSNRCQWLRGRLSSPPATNQQTAVAIVADAAVRWQCRGAGQHYTAWNQAVAEGSQLSADESRRLAPFIKPAFGLPGKQLPLDHLQGHVAEYVWYILAQENLPPGLTLRAIEGPSFSVTSPGGDGLAVYQRGDAVLVFRLWEIKKHESATHISRAVSRAYKQLDQNAEFYLAQLTTLADNYEAEVAQLYAALSDLWVDRDNRAGAGVAVSTSDGHLPRSCFGTMHKTFPDLSVDQLEGLVVALGDFPAFVRSVRDRIWSVL
jgi:hypothetical protein